MVLLYIPGLVELDQVEKFAEHISSVDRDIPVMLLAFFPEYKLLSYRAPTLTEMITAYRVLREKLRNVKLGNIGVFCKTVDCIEYLIRVIGREAVGL